MNLVLNNHSVIKLILKIVIINSLLVSNTLSLEHKKIHNIVHSSIQDEISKIYSNIISENTIKLSDAVTQIQSDFINNINNDINNKIILNYDKSDMYTDDYGKVDEFPYYVEGPNTMSQLPTTDKIHDEYSIISFNNKFYPSSDQQSSWITYDIKISNYLNMHVSIGDYRYNSGKTTYRHDFPKKNRRDYKPSIANSGDDINIIEFQNNKIRLSNFLIDIIKSSLGYTRQTISSSCSGGNTNYQLLLNGFNIVNTIKKYINNSHINSVNDPYICQLINDNQHLINQQKDTEIQRTLLENEKIEFEAMKKKTIKKFNLKQKNLTKQSNSLKIKMDEFQSEIVQQQNKFGKIKAIIDNTKRKLQNEKYQFEKNKIEFEIKQKKFDQDISIYTSTDINNIDKLLSGVDIIKKEKKKENIVNKIYNFS